MHDKVKRLGAGDGQQAGEVRPSTGGNLQAVPLTTAARDNVRNC